MAVCPAVTAPASARLASTRESRGQQGPRQPGTASSLTPCPPPGGTLRPTPRPRPDPAGAVRGFGPLTRACATHRTGSGAPTGACPSGPAPRGATVRPGFRATPTVLHAPATPAARRLVPLRPRPAGRPPHTPLRQRHRRPRWRRLGQAAARPHPSASPSPVPPRPGLPQSARRSGAYGEAGERAVTARATPALRARLRRPLRAGHGPRQPAGAAAHPAPHGGGPTHPRRFADPAAAAQGVPSSRPDPGLPGDRRGGCGGPVPGDRALPGRIRR